MYETVKNSITLDLIGHLYKEIKQGWLVKWYYTNALTHSENIWYVMTQPTPTIQIMLPVSFPRWPRWYIPSTTFSLSLFRILVTRDSTVLQILWLRTIWKLIQREVHLSKLNFDYKYQLCIVKTLEKSPTINILSTVLLLTCRSYTVIYRHRLVTV